MVMRICSCGKHVPWRIKSGDRWKSLATRKRCFDCSPYKPGIVPNTERKPSSIKVVSWRKRAKLKAIQHKGGCCQICGYNRSVSALVFHHLDPSKKDFGLAGNTRSWESILAEIEKCVLLCANCHSEVHDGLIQLQELDSNQRLPS